MRTLNLPNPEFFMHLLDYAVISKPIRNISLLLSWWDHESVCMECICCDLLLMGGCMRVLLCLSVCLSVCLCFRPVSAPSMNWRTLESRHSGKFWGQKFTVTRSRIVSMAKVLHTSERKARQNMAGFWSRLKHSEVGQKWRSCVFTKVGYDEMHLMNLASFCLLTWRLYFCVKYGHLKHLVNEFPCINLSNLTQ